MAGHAELKGVEGRRPCVKILKFTRCSRLASCPWSCPPPAAGARRVAVVTQVSAVTDGSARGAQERAGSAPPALGRGYR